MKRQVSVYNCTTSLSNIFLHTTESLSHNNTINNSTLLDWWDAWEAPQDRDFRDNQNRIRKSARDARNKLAACLQELRQKQQRGHGRLQERQRVLQESIHTLAQQKPGSKVKRLRNRTNRTMISTNDFALADYASDDGNERKLVLKYEDFSDEEDNEQKEVSTDDPLHLLEGSLLDGSSAAFQNRPKSAVGGVLPGSGVRKIIYAARTHSQLTQFAREVKRIPGIGDTVRLVALGGRKALCGNTTLRQQHKAEHDLNEACLDLQKGSTGKRKEKKGSGCPLLASHEAVSTLSLHLLAEPTDIEEAAALGQSSQTCAYYAIRQSLPGAQVVVLPYSMLLSTQTRTAIGLSLRGSLVIVDEAHNLPEALRAIHSARVSLPIVQAALGQLGRYVEKYKDRLAGRNLYYLGQLRKTLVSFQKHLQKLKAQNRGPMLSVEDFLMRLRLHNTNFFKLLRYLQTSRLSQKLLGFVNHEETQGQTNENSEKISKHVSAMSIVEAFIEKLTSTVDEGKVVMDSPTNCSARAFRFVLLDPASFLAPVLKEAHAVALVGGTLRPFGHVASELLGDEAMQSMANESDNALAQISVTNDSYKQINERFTAFSCGHVVSSDRVFLHCFSCGPLGQKFDFRHRTRGTNGTVDELGRLLIRVMNSVPRGGIVVFLPSYSYEAQVVKRWKEQGAWDAMQKIATVFREPTNSRDVDRTLKDYSHRATSKGALLLSVIGGKMSEGINFADDMARCVVVVGLPYPDITDPELREKMSALDRSPEKGLTGKSYYQNLCMRAVNQSVGRAIRHAKDYAAILLVDERYSTDTRVWNALPSWLTAHSDCCKHESFEKGEENLKTFFDRFKA